MEPLMSADVDQPFLHAPELPAPPIIPWGPAGPGPVGSAGRGPAAADEATLLALVHRFAALYLEVEAGRREPRQLAGLVTPRLASRLGTVATGSTGAGRVHSVAGARSRSDRFDAVAIVRRGRRYGALAVRVLLVRGRWLVDQAIRPEEQADTVHPARTFMAGRPGAR